MLPPEQITQIKSQIIQQIGSTFPEDKKQTAIQQIEAMNPEQLEEFLKQNNLMKPGENPETTPCIFCSIVSGQTQSNKIDENSDAIAILEINPISKAHSLVIPKKHSEKVSKKTMQLARKNKKENKHKIQTKKHWTNSNKFIRTSSNKHSSNLHKWNNQFWKTPSQTRRTWKIKKQLGKKIKPKTIKQSKPKKLKEKGLTLL